MTPPIICDDTTPAPDVRHDRHQLHVLLMALLDEHLGPLDAEVIRSRYGLAGDEEMTVAQVAQRWGVTATRIQETEAHALHLLRHQSQHLRIFVHDFTEHDRDICR